MDVGMIIMAMEKALNRAVGELGGSPSVLSARTMRPEDLERIKGILDRFLRELATATTAVGVINAFERALVFFVNIGENMYRGCHKFSDDELNAKFLFMKTTAIMPMTPCNAIDEEMVRTKDTGNIRHRAEYVVELVAKAQAMLK